MSSVQNFIKYIPLLKQLVMRDLKVKYRHSFLGFLWSLLNPLLMMLVISAVFSTLFRFDIPNFPIYLLCGQIIFTFYSESTNAAMTSITSGGELLKKVYIPKYIFPVSRVLSGFVNLLFSLVAVIIMLFVTGTSVTPTILLFPVPLIYIICFATGMGMILCVLTVFFRDMIHLYSVLLTAWMYFTPIFYPAKLLIENDIAVLKYVLEYNPLYHYINYFRDIVMYGTLPSLQENLICMAFSVSVLIIGFWVFYKKQDKFVLYI